MDLGISGRTAIVAASSGGLGFATAHALVAAGASVAIGGRDAGRLDAAVERLRSIGADGRIVGVVSDVSTPAGAEAYVDEATAQLGAPDILVANGGGPPPGTFATTDLDAYRSAVDENLLATIAMCQRAVPPMVDAGWGRVLAITSIAVRQPIASLMASVTARAGLTGFLKVLATEVAASGVTVNSLQPGLHRTERLRSLHGDDLASLAAGVPTGTVGDPADFGALAAFLCSASAGFITGTAIPVDGGAAQALM